MALNPRNHRHGLAPLELVMGIPIMMFVVALSVAFGTAACWKLRGQVVARDAVWSLRWPRVPNNAVPGINDPRPVDWPAYYARDNSFPLAELNAIPAYQHPILRGPLPNVIVNGELFDVTDRLYVGHSVIDRRPPLLPNVGRFHFDTTAPLLEGTWQFRPMGLGSNTSRRFPLIYQIADPDPSKQQAWRAAIAAVQSHPQRGDWAVLDRDNEFRAWYGSSPEFHPRLGSFCGVDVDSVHRSQVLQLLQRIDGLPQGGIPPPPKQSGVPAVMARRFLAMYQQQLQALKNAVPPGPPAAIADLEQKIQQLQDFLNTLP